MNLHLFKPKFPASEAIRGLLTSLILVLISLGLTAPVMADDPDSERIRGYQSKLDKLYKSIDKVQQHLKSTRSKRSSVLTELKRVEARIKDNAAKLKNISNEVRKLDRRIEKMRKQLRQLDIQLSQQRQLLSEQLRAAYVSGSQQQLKMLLNQQDPLLVGRLQVYFDYLNRRRQQHIEAYSSSIVQKRDAEEQLENALIKQRDQLGKQKARKKQLSRQRLQRNQLLSKLDREIEDQEMTLSDLRSSRDRIESLLKSLGELLADIPAGPGDRAPFETRLGKLPWPVDGRFLARFGTSRNQGDLKWNGVLISQDYGSPVRAISHGRVVFSDWLQGFGFITILDHGNGYMTLYGHNESLFKAAGDWVESGEVIATVGDSGGHSKPALYFEIRERGKPVNPSRWCSRDIAHAS